MLYLVLHLTTFDPSNVPPPTLIIMNIYIYQVPRAALHNLSSNIAPFTLKTILYARENLEFNNNQIVYNGRLKYIKETNRFEEKNKISNSNFHLISVLCYINITIILFFQHVYECDKCLNCFVTYM